MLHCYSCWGGRRRRRCRRFLCGFGDLGCAAVGACSRLFWQCCILGGRVPGGRAGVCRVLHTGRELGGIVALLGIFRPR